MFRFRKIILPSLMILSSLFLTLKVNAVDDISWHIQPSHFGGVDRQGNVSLITKIGEFATKNGSTLPIYALFNSKPANASSFAGYEWKMPLLESSFIQLDENRFKFFAPNGWERLFIRNKKDSSTLRSSGGWKGKIRGGNISLWSKRGNKMIFRKGRLVSMTVEEGKFDFIYQGKLLTKIKEGGLTFLQVSRESNTIWLHLKNKNKIGLELSQRSRIQVIDNKKQIVGKEKSLGKVILPNGKFAIFKYGVNDELNPTFQFNKRKITWDATTRKVIQDGKWSYNITPSSNSAGNAAISRVNDKHQKEFWHKNLTKGEEIIEGIDGVRKISSWFTSGILRRRPRKEEEIVNGKKKILRQFSYNEKAQLIRIREPLTDTFLIYENDGRLAALIQNEKLVRKYTKNAALLAKQYLN